MGVISTPTCWRQETEAERDTGDLPKVMEGVSSGVST